MSARLRTLIFSGRAGDLVGLWKEPIGPRQGSAVFAHPHPLHRGTPPNRVVHRATRLDAFEAAITRFLAALPAATRQ